MSFTSYNFPAPAKLNLMLHVIARREDGYHALETVFRLIDFGDTITISMRNDGAIERSSELAGVLPDDDLVVRAARLLQQYSGITAGATLHVQKRIPLGGGLGGGSSDAATVLMALNDLWGIGLSRQTLMQLGCQLGADVPFFIFGRNAFATGIGDELTALTLPPYWYVVFHPGINVPTREIFASPLLTYRLKPSKIALLERREERRNDLQSVVCNLYPAVGQLVDELSQYGFPLMTGSGSCVFLECETKYEAECVYKKLSTRYNGFVSQGLDKHPIDRD